MVKKFNTVSRQSKTSRNSLTPPFAHSQILTGFTDRILTCNITKSWIGSQKSPNYLHTSPTTHSQTQPRYPTCSTPGGQKIKSACKWPKPVIWIVWKLYKKIYWIPRAADSVDKNFNWQGPIGPGLVYRGSLGRAWACKAASPRRGACYIPSQWSAISFDLNVSKLLRIGLTLIVLGLMSYCLTGHVRST